MVVYTPKEPSFARQKEHLLFSQIFILTQRPELFFILAEIAEIAETLITTQIGYFIDCHDVNNYFCDFCDFCEKI